MLCQPALAWAQRSKVTGPHFAALEVAKLFKDLTGKFPSFDR